MGKQVSVGTDGFLSLVLKAASEAFPECEGKPSRLFHAMAVAWYKGAKNDGVLEKILALEKKIDFLLEATGSAEATGQSSDVL